MDEIEKSKVVVINGIRFMIRSRRRKQLVLEAFELKEDQLQRESMEKASAMSKIILEEEENDNGN